VKTLVLSVGNPILSDDGVGFQVTEALKGRVDEERVTVLDSSRNWLDIVELLAGYEKAIIIDGIQTRKRNAGEVYRLSAADFEAEAYAVSDHLINFGGAFRLARAVGMPLPQGIVVFAVEMGDVTTFSENCTPEVERAIPAAAEIVIQELEHLSLAGPMASSSG